MRSGDFLCSGGEVARTALAGVGGLRFPLPGTLGVVKRDPRAVARGSFRGIWLGVSR